MLKQNRTPQCIVEIGSKSFPLQVMEIAAPHEEKFLVPLSFTYHTHLFKISAGPTSRMHPESGHCFLLPGSAPAESTRPPVMTPALTFCWSFVIFSHPFSLLCIRTTGEGPLKKHRVIRSTDYDPHNFSATP